MAGLASAQRYSSNPGHASTICCCSPSDSGRYVPVASATTATVREEHTALGVQRAAQQPGDPPFDAEHGADRRGAPESNLEARR